MNDDDEARHHPLDDCDHDDDACPESERDAYLAHLDAEPRGPRYARRAPLPEPFSSAQEHLRAHLDRLRALLAAAEPEEELAEDPNGELPTDVRSARAASRARFLRRVAGELLDELRRREALTTSIPLPIRDLEARLDLSQRELDALLLAASPQLDRRSREALRKVDPFVDHPLVHTLCKVLAPIDDDPGEVERLFWRDGALFAHDLIRLGPGRSDTANQLAWEEPEVPLRVVALLLGQDLRGDLLARFATSRRPERRLDELAVPVAMRKLAARTLRGHAKLAERAAAWGLGGARGPRRALVLLLTGPSGSDERAFVDALAHAEVRTLLEIDAVSMRALAEGREARLRTDLAELLGRVAHEARMHGALVFLPEAERVFPQDVEASSLALFVRGDAFAAFDGVVVLSTSHPRALAERVRARVDLELALPAPTATERVLQWRRALPSALPLGDDVDLERLAQRYELGPAAIEAAVLAAARDALGRGRERVSMRGLEEAAARVGKAGWQGAQPPSA